MVSKQKKKSQNKKQLNRLDDILYDFVIGNGITANTIGNEAAESQFNGLCQDFEGIVDSASQNQVIESNTDDRIRNSVNSAVIVVENRMHDAILTPMNIVVITQVERAVRSITGSSRNGPNNIVYNLDRRNFTGITETTPLR